jgi:hypothetical protein
MIFVVTAARRRVAAPDSNVLRPRWGDDDDSSESNKSEFVAAKRGDGVVFAFVLGAKGKLVMDPIVQPRNNTKREDIIMVESVAE